MTPAEFLLNEVPTFTEGDIVLIAGGDMGDAFAPAPFDTATVWGLINQSKQDITDAGGMCLSYDSAGKVLYQRRDTVFNRPDPASETNEGTEEAVLFEYVWATAKDDFVVFVSHEFDRNDVTQNPNPKTIAIDTVLSLIGRQNVKALIGSMSRRTGLRELFEFVTRIYYFDTETQTITFVKQQQM